MSKKFRFLSLMLVVALCASLFAGCGDTKSAGGKTIVVWSHLQDEEVGFVRTKAEEWAKKTGNTVKVIRDNSEFAALVAAAKSPVGPDVVYGQPHDTLGKLAKAGVAAEIPAGTIDSSKYIKSTLDACMYDGKMYGVPITAETYALYYNKDMIKDAPKTYEEFMSIAKTKGFTYNLNEPYFIYAFIAAHGGYIFKFDNGKYDTNNIGLDNTGGVEGYKMIMQFVTDKIIAASTDGDRSKADFINKKAAMYISGPWELSGEKGLTKIGMNVGVATLPAVDGKPMPSFLGVQMGIVNAGSKNKAEATDLLKYLQDNCTKDITKFGRLSVLLGEKPVNPLAEGFQAQIQYAQPMPNVPAMDAVWKPMGENCKLMTAGKFTPEACAKQTVADIKKGVDLQNK
ncbi:MAG: maltose ABC transporter substrate-binding protein [Bacillota bacterium]